MLVRTKFLLTIADASRLIEQLGRVIRSGAFRPVNSLHRFLTLVVTENMAGRDDNLKEFLIGVEVSGKDASIDSSLDPVVRVHARRLRARLNRYSQHGGRSDEILIDLANGGESRAFPSPRAMETKSLSVSAPVSGDTIAVVRFADESADRNLEYFCGGLTEEIVHNLTQAGRLRVIAWNPSEDWTGAAALRITGSIRKIHDKLRIIAHLVDAATGRYLWSATFDGQPEGAVTLQEDVARSVLEALQSEFEDETPATAPAEHRAACGGHLEAGNA